VLSATLIGHVAERNVLLVDDIIDTASSVIAAVDELKQHEARDITVACAHPLLSGSAWSSLSQLARRAGDEGWCFRLIGTTSVAHENTPDWYHAYPIEPLLSQVLTQINSRGSVTEL
jgi:ribose-phosphate pyrophosphokinase